MNPIKAIWSALIAIGKDKEPADNGCDMRYASEINPSY